MTFLKCKSVYVICLFKTPPSCSSPSGQKVQAFYLEPSGLFSSPLSMYQTLLSLQIHCLFSCPLALHVFSQYIQLPHLEAWQTPSHPLKPMCHFLPEVALCHPQFFILHYRLSMLYCCGLMSLQRLSIKHS